MIAWLKAVVIVVSAIIGVGSTLVLKMKHDNPVEETTEQIIQNETGLDIDLTPTSPEKPVQNPNGTAEPTQDSKK